MAKNYRKINIQELQFHKIIFQTMTITKCFLSYMQASLYTTITSNNFPNLSDHK